MDMWFLRQKCCLYLAGVDVPISDVAIYELERVAHADS